MGYTISELNEHINYAKTIKGYCDKVLATLGEYQTAIDECKRRLSDGFEGESDTMSIAMLNDTFSAEGFDGYDSYLATSYMGFLQAYNSGENPFSFYDKILEARKNIKTTRQALVDEFNSKVSTVESYASAVSSLQTGVNKKKEELEKNIATWEQEIENIRAAEQKKKQAAETETDTDTDSDSDDSGSDSDEGGGASHDF